MKHIYKTTLFIAFVLLAAQGVFAEEVNTSASANTGSSTIKNDLRLKAEAVRMENKDKRVEFKTEIDSKRGEIKDLRVGAANMGSSTIRTEVKEKAEFIRTEIKDKREEVKTEIKTNKTELRTEIKTKVASQLKEKIGRIAEELRKVIANLEKIAVRIEAEIAKVKSRGNDVTSSENSLAAARVKMAVAQTSVLAIVEINASTTDPAGTLALVKSASETSRKAVLEARDALVAAMKVLKSDASVRVEVKATSTVSE